MHWPGDRAWVEGAPAGSAPRGAIALGALSPEVFVQPPQAAVAFVTACIHAAVLHRVSHGAPWFLHVPAVVEPALRSQLRDFTETQRGRLQVLDGGCEVANAR